jgi:hypothetical protein
MGDTAMRLRSVTARKRSGSNKSEEWFEFAGIGYRSLPFFHVK